MAKQEIPDGYPRDAKGRLMSENLVRHEGSWRPVAIDLAAAR